MKKIALLVLCIGLGLTTWAQKVGTIAEVDSLAGKIYRSYEKQWASIGEQHQKAEDSVRKAALEKQYAQSELKCNAEVLALYAKYPKLEGAAQRYYRMRGVMSKKELERLYGKMPASVRAADPYAAGIRSYIDTRQVMVGDTVGTFGARMLHDVAFRFGELSALKDVLLIFGGWDCMGREMQLILQVLYRKVDLSQLELVSIFMDGDRQAFEQSVRGSGIPWMAVSDFKGELSPLNIAFGVQATPMCVYISKGGCVEEISLGVTNAIIERIEAKSYVDRREQIQ